MGERKDEVKIFFFLVVVFKIDDKYTATNQSQTDVTKHSIMSSIRILPPKNVMIFLSDYLLCFFFVCSFVLFCFSDSFL